MDLAVDLALILATVLSHFRRRSAKIKHGATAADL
jgi:hypothetical protein